MGLAQVLIVGFILLFVLGVFFQPFYIFLEATSDLFPNEYIASILGLLGIAVVVGFVLFAHKQLSGGQ